MVIAQRIMADGRRNKIAGNELGSLVNQLVKCVLPVGARFAPNDRACLILNRRPAAIYTFAIAFHIALLEIRSKAVQVLVVRQDGFSCRPEKIVVPDAKQC